MPVRQAATRSSRGKPGPDALIKSGQVRGLRGVWARKAASLSSTELIAAVLIIVGVAITALPKRRKAVPLADPLIPATPS